MDANHCGAPARSLFTSTKVFSLHYHIDITDADENIVYQADSQAISLHDKTDVRDADGNFVAHIERKVFSLHECHVITMASGTEFQLSHEIMHLVRDVTNIEGLGWQLRGDVLGLNFKLYDSDGSVIAVIGQKLLSLHDKYCIDIYKADCEQEVIALLIALQHMIRDRQVSSSNSASFTFSHG